MPRRDLPPQTFEPPAPLWCGAFEGPLRFACACAYLRRCAAMSETHPAMAEPGEPYGIVAIAASAGGITALGRVLGNARHGFRCYRGARNDDEQAPQHGGTRTGQSLLV